VGATPTNSNARCPTQHPPAAAKKDADALSGALAKLTRFSHWAAPKARGPALALPKFTPEQIGEVLKKGAEDTQSVIKQAGEAACKAFAAAAEMHKKYAPKLSDKPVEVCPILRAK